MRRRGLLVVGLALMATGCATVFGTRAPEVDVSGTWSGMWVGYGIVGLSQELTPFAGSPGTAPHTVKRGVAALPRELPALVELSQNGRSGRGRIVLDGTSAAEAVPIAIRVAGAAGSRVLFQISGSRLVMWHELGSSNFMAEFRIDGDQMVGHIRGAEPAVRIILTRERPAEARRPAPGAVVTPAPSRPVVPMPPRRPEAPGEAAPPKEPEAPRPPDVAVAPQPPSPAPEAPGRPAPKEFVGVPELQSVYFDFDKTEVEAAEAAVLDKNAEWLKGNDMRVLIEGHADERGTNEYNLALGERRAKAVREHLISRGIDGDRVTTMSYGEERPMCPEQNEECWRQNRRTDFLVRPK